MPNPIDEEIRRLNVTIAASMMKKIDDWRRHQEDVPNLSETVRRLLELGLEAAKKGGKHGGR